MSTLPSDSMPGDEDRAEMFAFEQNVRACLDDLFFNDFDSASEMFKNRHRRQQELAQAVCDESTREDTVRVMVDYHGRRDVPAGEMSEIYGKVIDLATEEPEKRMPSADFVRIVRDAAFEADDRDLAFNCATLSPELADLLPVTTPEDAEIMTQEIDEVQEQQLIEASIQSLHALRRRFLNRLEVAEQSTAREVQQDIATFQSFRSTPDFLDHPEAVNLIFETELIRKVAAYHNDHSQISVRCEEEAFEDEEDIELKLGELYRAATGKESFILTEDGKEAAALNQDYLRLYLYSEDPVALYGFIYSGHFITTEGQESALARIRYLLSGAEG